MKLLDDLYLKPYEEAIHGRSARAFRRATELTRSRESLAAWASAHLYYGLHRDRGGWIFRERAPHATAIELVGDFNGWRGGSAWQLKRLDGSDTWEGHFARAQIKAGEHYLLRVSWNGGSGERVPTFARYVVQDPTTKLFTACVWAPTSPYVWHHPRPAVRPTPMIYEAHVGMAGEDARVSTYAEFRDRMLPRILAAGYDTVQLMGIMEHPYYGSFGYHVSSFFAPSSRFGSPGELKSLVDAAHGLGLRVIMDLVHSHAVANERDGLTNFDGDDTHFFHAGAKGWHSAWGSRCFDYGRTDVLHFLLSNCRYWLEEFHFDGFRFDGVTSMLFWDHGLGTAFTDYSRYFDGSMDDDAWVYLQLANRVIHEVESSAVTIAEDVSGLPGVAAPVADCGIGFDYRMAMGEPDFWFRLAEKVRDEDWPMGGLYHALTDRRAEEKVVSYVESHDQALVGGKTFLFQLADKEVYWGMRRDQPNLAVERALALHKMARLATCALSGGAYLNFMGNEFGHPEWIDFPRAENGWSYAHARRQWSLANDPELRFKALRDFDAEMLRRLRGEETSPGETALAAVPVRLAANEPDKVLAFVRGNLLFAFNFHPRASYADYGILVPPASVWQHLFDTDEPRFGGQGRIASGRVYAPRFVRDRGEFVQQVSLYLPARTAVVLRRRQPARPSV